MDLHVVAVDEAEHVDTRSSLNADAGGAVDVFALHDATSHVDQLQHGVAFVADDDFAVAEEGEFVTVLFDTGEASEHQGEAGGVVVHSGVEAVARVSQQVDIGTGHIVDEVEVFHLYVSSVDGEGVGAIGSSLEVERHLTFSFTTHHGKLFVVLDEVELVVALIEHELVEGATFAEADAGEIAMTHVVAHSDVEFVPIITKSNFITTNLAVINDHR